MKHPPIPNHPRFREQNGVTYFQPAGRGFVGPIDRYSGDERKDLANCARCAWLDFAECAHHEVSRNAYNPDAPELLEAIFERDKANENASAWAAWGRGEWKPETPLEKEGE